MKDSCKVLVVDDAMTVRMYLKSILEQQRIEVLEARDGMEGLEILSDVVPTFIFSDINLPNINGYEFVSRLRERAELQKVPVIMCSTESRDVDEIQAYEAGANFYIRKPIKEELVIGVAEVLGGSL